MKRPTLKVDWTSKLQKINKCTWIIFSLATDFCGCGGGGRQHRGRRPDPRQTWGSRVKHWPAPTLVAGRGLFFFVWVEFLVLLLVRSYRPKGWDIVDKPSVARAWSDLVEVGVASGHGEAADVKLACGQQKHKLLYFPRAGFKQTWKNISSKWRTLINFFWRLSFCLSSNIGLNRD